MKRDTDSEFTMVYDGWQDPTIKSFSTITDAQMNPLIAANYLFKVSTSP